MEIANKADLNSNFVCHSLANHNDNIVYCAYGGELLTMTKSRIGCLLAESNLSDSLCSKSAGIRFVEIS